MTELGPSEARRLTDEVKRDAQGLWAKLTRLHEGEAHRALGYDSWAAYMAAEFGVGQSQAYRLLDAGRVVAAIEGHSPNGEPLPANEAQARELVPVLHEEGAEGVIEAWRELRAEYPDEPLTGARIKQLVRNRLSRKQREEEIRREAEYDGAALEGERYVLLHGDAASVELPFLPDVIICDPPYPTEFLDCYEKVAELGARVLPEGGSVLTMAGQQNLPAIHERMSRHLQYRWEFAWLYATGPKQRYWPRRVFNAWKPVLWYAKGESTQGWVRDVIANQGVPAEDKRYHKWGQSVCGMRELVEMFSRPGETVLDPFVGGGATGVAALEAGRRFIGVDVDKAAIATAAQRLAA